MSHSTLGVLSTLKQCALETSFQNYDRFESGLEDFSKMCVFGSGTSVPCQTGQDRSYKHMYNPRQENMSAVMVDTLGDWSIMVTRKE